MRAPSQFQHLLFATDVHIEIHHFAAGHLNPLSRLATVLDVSNGQPSAILRQPNPVFPTKPLRCTGDDDGLTVQLSHQILLTPVGSLTMIAPHLRAESAATSARTTEPCPPRGCAAWPRQIGRPD